MIISGIYLTYGIHESGEKWSAWWYVATVYLSMLGAYMVVFSNMPFRRREHSDKSNLPLPQEQANSSNTSIVVETSNSTKAPGSKSSDRKKLDYESV